MTPPMGQPDKLEVEITEDGTVKSTSGQVSAVNHKNADAFYAYLASLMGGTVTRTPIARQSVHAHEHASEHEH